MKAQQRAQDRNTGSDIGGVFGMHVAGADYTDSIAAIEYDLEIGSVR